MVTAAALRSRIHLEREETTDNYEQMTDGVIQYDHLNANRENIHNFVNLSKM